MMISSIIQQHPISHKGISVNSSPAAWQVWGKGPRPPTPTFILGKKKHSRKKAGRASKTTPHPLGLDPPLNEEVAPVIDVYWYYKKLDFNQCILILIVTLGITQHFVSEKKQSIVIFVGKNAVKRSNRAVLSFLISLKILVVWWKGIQNIVTQSSKNVWKECLQNSN